MQFEKKKKKEKKKKNKKKSRKLDWTKDHHEKIVVNVF